MNTEQVELIVEQKRGRGRPKGTAKFTEEEKKEKKRLLNANRGDRPIIRKFCECCNKEYNGNNYARHLKGNKHINNSIKLNGNI